MNWDNVADSGKRQEFETGARRDTDEGKPRFDLIPEYSQERLAVHMANGAKKYGDHNWRRGMPLERFYGSALRHIYAWAQGDTKEDHLAAAAFNIFGIIYIEQEIRMGRLDWSLANKGPLQYEGPEEMVEEVMDLQEEQPLSTHHTARIWELVARVQYNISEPVLWNNTLKERWESVQLMRYELVDNKHVFFFRDDVGNVFSSDDASDFRIS